MLFGVKKTKQSAQTSLQDHHLLHFEKNFVCTADTAEYNLLVTFDSQAGTITNFDHTECIYLFVLIVLAMSKKYVIIHFTDLCFPYLLKWYEQKFVTDELLYHQLSTCTSIWGVSRAQGCVSCNENETSILGSAASSLKTSVAFAILVCFSEVQKNWCVGGQKTNGLLL